MSTMEDKVCFAITSDWASLMAQMVKNLPAVQDPGSIPGLGRCPGEGNGFHSSILAWRIPWTEELGRLKSRGLQNQTWLSD